ncbi:chaperonin 10-like protein [Ilyonectria destructans]|nr:chaperonin 10-like protein [Ilyonectria destructans]
MKEAIVAKGPSVKIIDSPVPEPNDDQVVIKVVVSGTNPKDWKAPDIFNVIDVNQGDDIAGIVHTVGANVTEFRPGDRVCAFHQMLAPGGSYAEYAVAWAYSVFHLPKKTSFEEAATIPLAALTAVVGLYRNDRLGLPQPWAPAEKSIPLVIYGGGTAVGSYAIQLAIRSNIHPLICVAGKSQEHVESLIDRSKGDTIVDYRGGNGAVIEGIRKALGSSTLMHALDAVAEAPSYANLTKVLAPGAGRITLVQDIEDLGDLVNRFKTSQTKVASVHEDAKDMALVYTRYFHRGLQEGWFRPHPHQVVPGGLGGLQKALEDLKAGKASATKSVVRIAETKGIEGTAA